MKELEDTEKNIAKNMVLVKIDDIEPVNNMNKIHTYKYTEKNKTWSICVYSKDSVIGKEMFYNAVLSMADKVKEDLKGV